MEQRLLGRSGRATSVIGLDARAITHAFAGQDTVQAFAILAQADRLGVSHWRASDVVFNGQSEQLVGAWQHFNDAQRLISTTLGRNSELYPARHQYDRMRRSLESSLTRLRLSALPLLNIQGLSLEQLRDAQTWRWLDDFVSEGLIEDISVSVDSVEAGLAILDLPSLSALEIVFNLLQPNARDELLPKAYRKGVGIIARQPLASGLLGGHIDLASRFFENDYRHPRNHEARVALGQPFGGLSLQDACDRTTTILNHIDKPDEMSFAQLALRWVLDHREVSCALVCAPSLNQLEECAAVASMPPISWGLNQQIESVCAASSDHAVAV